MKKFLVVFVSLLLILSLLSSCYSVSDNVDPSDEEDREYEYYAINMNTEFPLSDNLLASNGETIRVIVLIGQSNATGCSLTSYLRDGVGEEKYAEYSAGYDNVLINFCLDNVKYTSGGEYRPVNLSCAAGEGYFGPELGMAEMLYQAYPDDKFVILKYTMSGYSLNHHWLYHGERAYIYNAFIPFVETYMDQMIELGYDAKIEAVCWMQGESDTTEYKGSRYLYNTERFVLFIRSDLAHYAADGGIYFIDAGIADGPYCLPAYDDVNEAKRIFGEADELNVYFSTIDMGLTTLYEPKSDPDLGHYDAMSELTLGRRFGEEVVKILSERK